MALLAGATVAGIAVFAMRNDTVPTKPVPISRVQTSDVHSLALLDSPGRVILGHHGGILESNDGGRTWSAWRGGSDAMSLGVAVDRPVIVAGHDVLALAAPDGEWSDIESDLPHTDIHGFARDPRDPDRVWAYLATGGLFESRDGGVRWEQVFAGHTFSLLAAAPRDETVLMAVDPERRGIVASADGGRTWELIGPPPSTPAYAMAATQDGQTLFFSGSEGLFRSDDGGRSFSALVDLGQPILAIATADEGSTLIVATRDRSIYRSDDGGQTWLSK